MVWNARLSQRLDEQPRLFQCQEVTFKRAMDTLEGHLHAGLFDRVSVAERLKIMAFDQKYGVGCLAEVYFGLIIRDPSRRI
jgi:hypothetical protein